MERQGEDRREAKAPENMAGMGRRFDMVRAVPVPILPAACRHHAAQRCIDPLDPGAAEPAGADLVYALSLIDI